MIHEFGIQDGMEKAAARRKKRSLKEKANKAVWDASHAVVGLGNKLPPAPPLSTTASRAVTRALMKRAAARRGRKRGPWARRLMMTGAAVGGLAVGGGFGRSIAKQYGLRAGIQAAPIGVIAGASMGAPTGWVAGVHADRFNKKAAIDPMKMQRAMELANGAIRAMGPAMLTGAVTGALMSRIRADKDKGSAMARGAIAGAALGGVIGTGVAMGESRKIFEAAGRNPQVAADHVRNLQRVVGAGAGAIGGMLPRVED